MARRPIPTDRNDWVRWQIQLGNIRPPRGSETPPRVFLERRFYRFDHAQRAAQGVAARAALAAAPGAAPHPPHGPGAAGPQVQGPPAGGGPQIAPTAPPGGVAGVGPGAPGAALPVPGPAAQPAVGAGNDLAGGTVPVVAPGPGHFAGMPAAAINQSDLARQALAQIAGGQGGQEEGSMTIDVSADGGHSDPPSVTLDADDERDIYPAPLDFGGYPAHPRVGGKAPAAAVPPRLAGAAGSARAARPQVAGKGPQGIPSRASRRGLFMESDPNFDRRRYYRSAREKVAKENPPDFTDGEWEPGWSPDGVHLGTGGMGAVFLYRRYDDNRVVDRVVAKDCYVDHASWSQYHNWDGDYRDPSTREHIEIACMRRVRDIPGLKCVIMRGEPEVKDEWMFYRIYMGFCPHKSLYDIVRQRDGSNMMDLLPYHEKIPIPEPAIWAFFNDLVDAFLVLQYGAVEEEDAKARWRPIVHRDVKLDNVFLDTPGIEFPSYPTARLGDFGLAVVTDETDANNPVAFNDGTGTRGWRAPEQCLHFSKDTLLPRQAWQGEKLGEKTNVWGIGAILIRLMNRDPIPDGPSWKNGEPAEPALKASSDVIYSEQLREHAQNCVQYDPELRPSLRELKEIIMNLTTPGGEQDLAKRMRTAKHNDNDAALKLQYPAEQAEYKIQTAVANA
ncbi:hypothetical protein LTR37_011275 [Vermiconidia calcicola]|uniref:Uncharacterized protein n=1 Tax=Vermiconidia calcicola TaxID=1690605 RepID=A0ACC3N2E0_9PEZI|nr:hypothetical protein LTR37_011275 [Vermiconidia calcicola]